MKHLSVFNIKGKRNLKTATISKSSNNSNDIHANFKLVTPEEHNKIRNSAYEYLIP